MSTAIKKQFQINASTWRDLFLMEISFFLFGAILLTILLTFGIEDVEDGFPLASFIAAFGAGIALFCTTAGNFSLYFHIETSLGCTRRQFTVSAILNGLAAGLACLALLLVLAAIEDTLLARFYTNHELLFCAFPIICRYGWVLALGIPAAGSLCGALLTRFGQTARIALLILWIFLCMFGPGAAETLYHPEAIENSVISSIVAALLSVLQIYWPGIAIVLILLMAGLVWPLLRRQQVY